MKILILGANGMLGNSMFRFFNDHTKHEAFATVRTLAAREKISPEYWPYILPGIDVENYDSLLKLFAEVRPNIVINCVGLVKQLASSKDPLLAIPINSILPHRLANLCLMVDARLIHISTDCVFSGTKGGYQESDQPDAHDLYGITKYLGEVDFPHAITLRTSIIGHELSSSHSLVNWFLSQTNRVNGFKRAIFSGLPTFELARVIHEYVIPNEGLHGLYHVSSSPISKFDLLTLLATSYVRDIEIYPDYSLVIDRSLDSSKFKSETNYNPPPWPELVRSMREFR